MKSLAIDLLRTAFGGAARPTFVGLAIAALVAVARAEDLSEYRAQELLAYSFDVKHADTSFSQLTLVKHVKIAGLASGLVKRDGRTVAGIVPITPCEDRLCVPRGTALGEATRVRTLGVADLDAPATELGRLAPFANKPVMPAVFVEYEHDHDHRIAILAITGDTLSPVVSFESGWHRGGASMHVASVKLSHVAGKPIALELIEVHDRDGSKCLPHRERVRYELEGTGADTRFTWREQAKVGGC